MTGHTPHLFEVATSHFPYRKKSFGDFFKNWIHPAKGIKSTLKLESSLRVEAAALPLALYLGTKRKIMPAMWLVLILPILLVLVVELLNTGVEEIVRHNHPRRSTHFGRAMDAAAAAVMIMILIAAICAAFALLIPSPRRFRAMGEDGMKMERARLSGNVTTLKARRIPLGNNQVRIVSMRAQIAFAEANLKVLDGLLNQAAPSHD
ncbi:MAG: diacylglycerol kinase [Candidatus Saccharibacteria bacterium]